MSKPIAIIYFPDIFDPVLKSGWIYEYMAALNGESVDPGKWNFKHDYSDYHWFCFYKYDIQEPQIQVFHEKDFTEIQYQELKKIIQDSLPKHSQLTEKNE